MIRYIDVPSSKDEILSLFDPLIREWFNSKFKDITEPQAYGISYIHKGKTVLVSAPTGSGKTLTGFLTILNELFLLAKKGELKEQVYCVYVSPLKALANDIHRNLEVPLKEIYELASKENVNLPKINVGVRSGDTTTAERQKMLKKPPHIFITTPESLGLVLSSLKFREKFRNVKYAIIDEIHELSSTKRGVMLSLNLERLEALAGEFVRIGLSATQSPIEEMAKFLGGFKNGELRDVYIAEVEAKKALDMRVLTTVPNLTTIPYEIANEKMYDMLKDIINTHKTTLIFTNTRSGSEHVALKLKQRGIESLEVHHSSLGKLTRLRVEESLKRGELKCVITSTSLELGIDIGYIDIVVQIGTPKSISKGLQRIGRSGHSYGETARGRFIVFDNDDLLECAVLTKCAYENELDRVFVPHNSLDVLAQVMVGMSLEKVWDVEEAYQLIKRSYCYHDLKKEEYLKVLNYLSGKTYGEPFYSKIWFDEDSNKFGKKRSTRMIYFMNMGTIPEEADFTVIDERNIPLGMLSEKFVERLRSGDIFVLGAKTYEYLKNRGTRVYVKSAAGRKPTVPSWTGEMLPRSFDLSIEVGKFRRTIETMIRNGEEVTGYLIEKCKVDDYGASSIVSYVKEQMLDTVPTDQKLLIEGYIDPSKKYNIIFHYPFGRRVNDALSRAYAYQITKKYKSNVRLSISDDAFMITLVKEPNLDEMKALVTTENLETILKQALHNTELFKQRFRHCGTRAFMVLRRYKTASISVARQQLRSERILQILEELKDFPIIDETYNEVFNIVMDLPNALEVLKRIEDNEIKLVYKPYSDSPSIFSNNIILSSISDIVLMEDKSALLKEIHLKVLEKIMPKEELVPMFDPAKVAEYFNSKFLDIKTKKDIISFFELTGNAELFMQKGVNIYSHTTMKYEVLRDIGVETLKEGEIQAIYTTQPTFTLKKFLHYYLTIYQHEISDAQELAVLNYIDGKTSKETLKGTGIRKSVFFDLLKKLERNNLIYRKGYSDGELVWGVRKIEKIDFTESIRFLVTKLLSSSGPLSSVEISYKLGLAQDTLNTVLQKLENEKLIIRGKFLPGLENQYLLTKDYEVLKSIKPLTVKDVKTYRFAKLTRKVPETLDYFDQYLFCYSPYSAFLRVENWKNWEELRLANKILYGKFLRKRLAYTSKTIAELFSTKKLQLSQAGKNVMKSIETADNTTYLGLLKNMKLDPKILKLELNILEDALYVSRKYAENESSRTVPEYVVMNIERDSDISELLQALVTKLGPLSVYDISRFLNMEIDETSSLIELLDLNTVNVEGVAYYLAKDEKLESLKSENSLILEPDDVFMIPYQSEIYSVFGDLYSHYLVVNGSIESALKLVNHDTYLEVSELMATSKQQFSLILKHLMALKNYYSYDLLVLNFKVSKYYEKELMDKGFKKLDNVYYFGDLYDEKFSKTDLYRYVTYKQFLNTSYKLNNVQDLETMNVGIRSDSEALCRVGNLINMEKYYRRDLLFFGDGMDNTDRYMSKESLILLKSVKNKKMDRNMNVVFNILKKNPYLKKTEVYEESPLGTELTKTALKELYESNYIAQKKDGSFYMVTEIKDPYFSAYTLLKKMFKAFGALNYERLKYLIEDAISFKEFKEHVKMLEKENFVKKLFFEDDMYWGLAEDLYKIKSLHDQQFFILSPGDPLHHYFRKEIKNNAPRNSYVIFNGVEIVGHFKGTTKKYELKIKEFGLDYKYKPQLKSLFAKIGVKISFVASA